MPEVSLPPTEWLTSTAALNQAWNFGEHSKTHALVFSLALIFLTVLLASAWTLRRKSPFWSASASFALGSVPVILGAFLWLKSPDLNPLLSSIAQEAEYRYSRTPVMENYTDELDADFAYGLKKLVEEASIKSSDENFGSWFEEAQKKIGLRSILTDGSRRYNLSGIEIEPRSMAFLPLIHAAIRLKTGTTQESAKTLATTIRMARDNLAKGFDSLDFLELFLNSPNQLFDAKGLMFLSEIPTLKAFWTWWEEPGGAFWYILGLVDPGFLNESFLQKVKNRETVVEGTRVMTADALPKSLQDIREIYALPVVYQNELYALSLIPVTSLSLRVVFLTPMKQWLKQSRKEEFLLYILMLFSPFLGFATGALIVYSFTGPLRSVLDPDRISFGKTGRDQGAELQKLFLKFLEEEERNRTCLNLVYPEEFLDSRFGYLPRSHADALSEMQRQGARIVIEDERGWVLGWPSSVPLPENDLLDLGPPVYVAENLPPLFPSFGALK